MWRARKARAGRWQECQRQRYSSILEAGQAAAIVLSGGVRAWRAAHLHIVDPTKAGLRQCLSAATSGQFLVLDVLADGAHADRLVEGEGASVLCGHRQAHSSAAAHPELAESLLEQR